MIGARGCPFKCIYCASDNRIRFRPTKHIEDEIAIVKERYGISNFSFEDDSFTFKKDRALDLCKRIKKYNIHWSCSTRVDLIDEEIVKNMDKTTDKYCWIELAAMLPNQKMVRGEYVNLQNIGNENQLIEPKQKLAQVVVVPIATPQIVETKQDPALMNTSRGSGGFGSTGEF